MNPISYDAAAVILLVDDHQENLLALDAVLEPLGHTLLCARSGEEALKHLIIHDVALILLDVKMPGMDGFETAAHIKERERTRDIPIIFLTAYSKDVVDAMEGFSHGAVDYVTGGAHHVTSTVRTAGAHGGTKTTKAAPGTPGAAFVDRSLDDVAVSHDGGAPAPVVPRAADSTNEKQHDQHDEQDCQHAVPVPSRAPHQSRPA